MVVEVRKMRLCGSGSAEVGRVETRTNSKVQDVIDNLKYFSHRLSLQQPMRL